MPVSDKDLYRLQGWPRGVNNIAREDQLGEGQVDRAGNNPGELRVGQNIDLDDAGKPEIRPGRTPAKVLLGLHSVWADDRFPLMLGVYNGNVIAFDADLNTSVIAPVTVAAAPLSVDVGAGSAWWCNGFDCGRVSPSGVAGYWAPEQPIGQPIVATTAAGGLYAGNYAVAITYLDTSGRESGSTLAVEVDVAEGQGIALTQIPQPTRGDTAWVRVYCTTADGDTLRFVRDLPVGLTTFLIGTHQPGKALETQFLEPLPTGDIVGFHMGHQFVWRGKVLFWSPALTYGLSNLQSSYLTFGRNGTLIAPSGEGAEAGVFIATAPTSEEAGSTYFMAGANPKAWQRARVYPHGAVPGSLAVVEAAALGLEVKGRVPYWLSDHGQLVVGLPSGRVQELHRDRFVANERVERAATALREYRGARTMITAARGGTVSPFAVSDTASAEVWRDGVRIS